MIYRLKLTFSNRIITIHQSTVFPPASSIKDFPGSSDGKESAYNAGDPGSIPGLGRSPGEGNGNPLQCSCLENPVDWGACLQSTDYSPWGRKESDTTERLNWTELNWKYIGVIVNSGPQEYTSESESEVAQLCLTLWDPMDCSLTGSSIHGIFQARILEWVAISFSRRSSQPRDWTWVSHIVGRCFTTWATRIAVKFGGGEFTRVNADIGVLSLCWLILGIWGSLGVRSACLMTSLCSVQLLDP